VPISGLSERASAQERLRWQKIKHNDVMSPRL